MRNHYTLLLAFAFLFIHKALAQQVSEINPSLLTQPWPAKWISYPGSKKSAYSVHLFRKSLSLKSVPDKYIIHITADNRYKLYINGKYVTYGPARSYLFNWKFESLDIAPLLKEGENIIAAVVWNFAHHKPLVQISGQPGLLIQGNTDKEQGIDTNNSWQVYQDSSYSPVKVNLKEYYVAGAGESFNSVSHPWNWMRADFDVAEWAKAAVVETAKPIGCMGEYGAPSSHFLSQRTIPLMEEKPQRFYKISRSNLENIPQGFLNGDAPLTVPANSTVKILIDQNKLTTAFPVLHFAKGKQSKITITYAESLYQPDGNKGNRNETQNKHIVGNADIIICDGGTNRAYQPLYWRTFRFIELVLETKNTPLVLNDFYSIFTAYPFEEKASFSSDVPGLNKIWEVGWHTQRLCAHETFFDCPYYEQLQYIGDARIQALVSTYVSGDTRLTKNALLALHDSQLPNGLTQSRYPSNTIQIIPPFSLVWVTMAYDYWMLNNDSLFVKKMIPAMQRTLDWFESRIDSTGMLGPVEWWNFVDWVNVNGWDAGNPPQSHHGNSAILSLQFIYTLQKAVKLFNGFGLSDLAAKYEMLGNDIRRSVYQYCFDSDKGLMADSPQKDNFSQHANILAILTDTFSEPTSHATILHSILNQAQISQATLYFKFYLFEALEKAGLGHLFLETLGPWQKMLGNGLSTFAETPDPTRSDCHAWSASPVYYFLSLVAGVKPGSPGFKTVKIAPQLENLKHIAIKVPHRLGMIDMKLEKRKNNRLKGSLILPPGLRGVFIWKGQQQQLFEGLNHIDL